MLMPRDGFEAPGSRREMKRVAKEGVEDTLPADSEEGTKEGVVGAAAVAGGTRSKASRAKYECATDGAKEKGAVQPATERK